MIALVTGGTGFVGSHLVESLGQRGDAVRALYRRPEAKAALEASGAEPVLGALDDAAALARALEGVDVVYHVAGLTSGTEAELMAVNAGATQSLLQLCGAATLPPRFVYVSSQAALGPSRQDERLAENAPCRPLTPYGRSKLAGETAVKESRVRWTVVRPPAVYGPRDREFLRLFRIAKSGVAPVFGMGRQQLSMVYVADLADAIARAGREDCAVGQVYHAAHPEVVTAAGVAREAGAALGRRPVILPLPAAIAAPIVSAIGWAAERAGRRTVVNGAKMAEFLAPAWLLDSGKAARELGWQPAWPLARGFAETAGWYRRHGWLS